jgi:hypothetical protein
MEVSSPDHYEKIVFIMQGYSWLFPICQPIKAILLGPSRPPNAMGNQPDLVTFIYLSIGQKRTPGSTICERSFRMKMGGIC